LMIEIGCSNLDQRSFGPAALLLLRTSKQCQPPLPRRIKPARTPRRKPWMVLAGRGPLGWTPHLTVPLRGLPLGRPHRLPLGRQLLHHLIRVALASTRVANVPAMSLAHPLPLGHSLLRRSAQPFSPARRPVAFFLRWPRLADPRQIPRPCRSPLFGRYSARPPIRLTPLYADPSGFRT
jgi:hypothetical protein